MDDSIDVAVIGAGVVGLAIGRELARAGREVVVIEKNADIGQETSSRNSEVIHAGIYYPTDSNKAHLCVRGKELLYRYCENKGVPHKRCGKILVALDVDTRGVYAGGADSPKDRELPDGLWVDEWGVTRRRTPNGRCRTAAAISSA